MTHFLVLRLRPSSSLLTQLLPSQVSINEAEDKDSIEIKTNGCVSGFTVLGFTVPISVCGNIHHIAILVNLLAEFNLPDEVSHFSQRPHSSDIL